MFIKNTWAHHRTDAWTGTSWLSEQIWNSQSHGLKPSADNNWWRCRLLSLVAGASSCTFFFCLSLCLLCLNFPCSTFENGSIAIQRLCRNPKALHMHSISHLCCIQNQIIRNKMPNTRMGVICGFLLLINCMRTFVVTFMSGPIMLNVDTTYNRLRMEISKRSIVKWEYETSPLHSWDTSHGSEAQGGDTLQLNQKL